MELGELLLLVRTDPIEGTTEVVSEADFVRYMTTDTDRFYPQASASAHSTRAHLSMNGYAWFTEHVGELAENTGQRRLQYLIDVCSNLDGWDFEEDCAHDNDPVSHSFVYASALNPALLTNLSIRGFGPPRPFLWETPLNPPQLPEAAKAEQEQNTEPRPLWLL